jgi:6-phosphogluconolactonase
MVDFIEGTQRMMSDVRTLDYGDRGTVLVVADGDALASTAAALVASTVDEVAATGRRALIALSGGSTPKKMGELFAREPLSERIKWDSLEVFWGDERWVPLDNPDSNAGEAMRGFLDTASVPNDRIHPFDTEKVEPEASAQGMENVIRELQPDSSIPRFDLILLGMGDDGHTASLFPGTSAIHETQRLVVSHRVDKLDATRLTFTPPLINAAHRVVFLVGGAGKAAMLATVLDGAIDVDSFPSQVVRPGDGRLTWLIDEAAAANLERPATNG